LSTRKLANDESYIGKDKWLSLCLLKHHVMKKSGDIAQQHILILWMELRGIFQTSVVLPSEN